MAPQKEIILNLLLQKKSSLLTFIPQLDCSFLEQLSKMKMLNIITVYATAKGKRKKETWKENNIYN